MSATMHKTRAASATRDAAARSFRFRISDGSPDREHDRVNPAGWALANYRRAPVVLWAHDHGIPAIAKCTSIAVEGTGPAAALMATAEFPPVGIHPLADQVHDLIAAGIIASTSVGFLPERVERNDLGGNDILEQELIEFSIVNVGALPSALLEGRGADALAIRKWLGVRADPADEELFALDDDDGGDDAEIEFEADAVAAISAARRRAGGDPLMDASGHRRHIAGDTEITREEVDAMLRAVFSAAVREGVGDVKARVDAELARRRGRVY
jgi:hypothetical protein